MGKQDDRESTDWREELEGIGRRVGRLWTSSRQEDEPRSGQGHTPGQVIAIGVCVLIVIGLILFAVSWECDEDCMDARAERTVVAELEQARTACEGQFREWRDVEQTIKNATRFPTTFEWESKILGQVAHYYQCANDVRPYHTYQAEFDVSNAFGVPERHQVVINVYPDDGLYEVVAFGEVIGIGLIED